LIDEIGSAFRDVSRSQHTTPHEARVALGLKPGMITESKVH
jgi:hypothetical protein